MAIALDTSVDGGTVTATSLTYSHTITGSNTALIVAIRSRIGTSESITGVTYATVPMTLIDTVASDNFIRPYSTTWLLMNPTTGANNVVISGSPSANISAMSASYTGVKQTGQPDAHTTATAGSSPVSKAITTVADNCWVVGFASMDNNTPTANTGITFRKTAFHLGIGDSNAAVTPAGSYTMAANGGSSGSLVLMLISLAPDVPASSGFFTIL